MTANPSPARHLGAGKHRCSGASPLGRIGMVFAVGGCFLMASTTTGAKDSAPPSPDRPWSPPDLPAHQAELQSRRVDSPGSALVDPRKLYHLPELIDLAQQLNPDTKVAWQRVKQALAAVGLKEVTYYPILSAAAASGYTRLFAPLPTLNINRAALVRAIETGGWASSANSSQRNTGGHLDISGEAGHSVKRPLFRF